ncbi:MAG: type III-B CRISPR module RAMP protein Cmr6 [Verrucomicrobia bacterium]|nr:type III-B CRISPR module RAMP protein Cmr6 [Verrucomicrobiota bacterium]
MLAVTQPVASALARVCDAWHLRLDKLSFERGGEASSKTDSLKSVLATYEKCSARLLGVCRSRQRLLQALQDQHGNRFNTVELVLESKLLIHLGRANVLENVGLYADRTTGLPLIPGTALKGVVSTWACWEANQRPEGSFNQATDFLEFRAEFNSKWARRVFGDNARDGSECAGEVIFLGGFPVQPPTLGLDIVNPHHDAAGQANERLTPNAFLCVEPGGVWRFAYFVRTGVADYLKLISATTAWLTEALTQLGIGAKTSGGYGRFRQLTDSDRARLTHQAQQAEAEAKAAADRESAAKAKAEQEAVAQAALKSDYPNEATYKSSVLRLADNPGHWTALQKELEKLRKPENAAWFERFKRDTTGKAYRKLRDQPWYPK